MCPGLGRGTTVFGTTWDSWSTTFGPVLLSLMHRLRVAAAQLNLVVGDLPGNASRIAETYRVATERGCDVVAFPELSVTGYPPEDLLHRPAFVAEAMATLSQLAAMTGEVAAVIGFPHDSGVLTNAAAMCAHGAVQGIYFKHRLPNYSVFDEERYFTAVDRDGPLFTVAGVPVALSICEDAWSADGPIASQAAAGAALIVNINASPFYAGRLAEREAVLGSRAREARVPVVYVNLVGGQDGLVFDGASFVLDADGAVVARAAQMCEELLVVDLEVPSPAVEPQRSGATLPTVTISSVTRSTDAVTAHVAPILDPDREIYEALVLGTRDYVRKNGFTDVLIGLSGGVDSSIVAAIAVDALGAEHVTGVLMPSRFSSPGSITDAERLADSLGITALRIPIEPAHAALLSMLEVPFTGTRDDHTEENIQARVRGTILMALSNKFGSMVLTTANKSETATGYSTLYGDMAGGFAVIMDVPKTRVYDLCHDLNARAGRELIPESVLLKPPSAELRPDQRDEDSLPPYPLLDAIIAGYVDDDCSTTELIAAGYPPEIVDRVASLVDHNEYKRRQAAPGVRISAKAFGKDRRFPITNRWRG